MTEITTPSGLRWAAVGAFACALFCIYGGATATPDSESPAWVMYVFSMPFAAVGVAMLNRAAGVVESGEIYAFVFLLCFGIVFAWIPFASHTQNCTSSSSFLFWSHRSSGGSSCARTFGFVGWLMIAGAVMMAVRWIRSLLDD